MTVTPFDNNKKPTWCTGCGHFGVLNSIKTAFHHLNLDPKDTSVVTGIGCSGRLFQFLSGYNFHSMHGRALPIAQGIKCANKNLHVIAAGGDGDGFAIGLNHTLHAMRRNIDITYITMSNRVYGLTKGHTSPMSYPGFETKSTPYGAKDSPIEPILLSLSVGTGFVAQGFSGNPKQLATLIEKGIQHKGFSFINVFSPCVTFNKNNSYQWYQKHLHPLDEEDGYEFDNLSMAMNKTMEHEGLLTGVIYESPTIATHNTYAVDPSRPIKISQEEFSNLLNTL